MGDRRNVLLVDGRRFAVEPIGGAGHLCAIGNVCLLVDQLQKPFILLVTALPRPRYYLWCRLIASNVASVTSLDGKRILLIRHLIYHRSQVHIAATIID